MEPKIYSKNYEWSSEVLTADQKGITIELYSRIQGTRSGSKIRYYWPVVVGDTFTGLDEWDPDRGYNELWTMAEAALSGCIKADNWRVLRRGHIVQ